MEHEDDLPAAPLIAPINIKVPPFWRANPRIWFCQIEAQFANSRVSSDSTKYNTVVASLEGIILAQVSDIILNPPNTNVTSIKL